MKITILGCATSMGVPVLGCQCEVCTSDDPKNNRTRSSVFIEVNGSGILIDTSTDMRAQVLREKITRIDAVLYTHSHADHTHGIDDLKAFNYINSMSIDCYANAITLDSIKQNFGYLFRSFSAARGKPRLDFKEIKGELEFAGIKIKPIEILHHRWDILGYRVGDFAYLTDCSSIPESSQEKLQGLDFLILGALRYKAHEAHFNVEQAVTEINKLRPKRALLTHMGHEIDYNRLKRELPDYIEPAYDGAQIELPEF